MVAEKGDASLLECLQSADESKQQLRVPRLTLPVAKFDILGKILSHGGAYIRLPVPVNTHRRLDGRQKFLAQVFHGRQVL